MMRNTTELGVQLFDGMHLLSSAVAGRAVPVSELCDIFANLEAAGGYNLSELLTRLAQGIERHLQAEETVSPALHTRLAAALTREAAVHAQQIALCMGAALGEIATTQAEGPSVAVCVGSRKV